MRCDSRIRCSKGFGADGDLQGLAFGGGHGQQALAQGVLGVLVAMDETHFARQFAHPADEVDQIVLAGVGGVAADAADLGADGVALVVEFDVAAFGAVLLDLVAGCAGGLEADEQDVVARVFDHRLDVIDDAAAGRHAAGGDHHGGAAGLHQVVDQREVILVRIDRDQVVERQRMTAGTQPLVRLGVPPGLQRVVRCVEASRQRRIDNDGEITPARTRRPVNQALKFVQQFLGPADAESRDHDGAAVLQRMLDGGLQAQAAHTTVFMVAVAVGALQHHGVRTLRRLGRGQQRRVRRAEVAREHDALAARAVADVEFRIGGAEDVSRALQAQAQRRGGVVDEHLPFVVVDGDRLLADHQQRGFDEPLVAGEADFQRVFDHQRQECGRRLGAVDRPAETGRQQVWKAAHVVNVHVGDHQGPHVIDGEVDPLAVRFIAATGLRTLEQATVDQDGVVRVQLQAMATSGGAGDGAVVEDARLLVRHHSACAATMALNLEPSRSRSSL